MQTNYRHAEPETKAYNALAGASTDWRTINERIKSIKYSTGVTLSSVTCKLSLVSGAYFITQSSTDLRPYALIPGVQFSVSDGTKAAVFSGTMTPGTGETLSYYINGATKNGNMETGDPPTGWNAATCTRTSVADERTGGAGTKSINVQATQAYGSSEQDIGCAKGDLLKVGGWAKKIDSDCRIGISNIPCPHFATTGEWQESPGFYKTAHQSSHNAQLLVATNGGQVRFDDVSYAKVLTPSTTGFTASALTDAGINPNANSFTITITKP